MKKISKIFYVTFTFGVRKKEGVRQLFSGKPHFGKKPIILGFLEYAIYTHSKAKVMKIPLKPVKSRFRINKYSF